MKTIIGVWHTNSVGRRSTLREFAKMLLETHPSAEIISFEQEEKPIYSVPDSGDFRLVLKIKGKTIGIECKLNSYNQPTKQLQKLVENYNCDILLWAANEGGVTTDTVEEFIKLAKNDCRLVWTSTYQAFESCSEGEMQGMNRLKAVHLIDLINHIEFALL
jgi:hypothetical protein